MAKKYKLTKNSRLVKGWVYRIETGLSTFDDVPPIFNLRDLVAEALGLVEVDEDDAQA